MNKKRNVDDKKRTVRDTRLRGLYFTLIELMIVVGIIGVLMTLLLPALAKARFHANLIACMNNLKQQYLALGSYCEDSDRRYPKGHDDMCYGLASHVGWFSMGTVYKNGYFDDKHILIETDMHVREEPAASWNSIYYNIDSLQRDTKHWSSGTYVQFFYDYGRRNMSDGWGYPVRLWGRTPTGPRWTETLSPIVTTGVIMCYENYTQIWAWQANAHNGRRVNVVYEDGHAKDLDANNRRTGENTNRTTQAITWWQWAYQEDQQ